MNKRLSGIQSVLDGEINQLAAYDDNQECIAINNGIVKTDPTH